MGGIRDGICPVCPLTWHTQCATSDDRETEMVAVLPLL
jgi:hypothetical protein